MKGRYNWGRSRTKTLALPKYRGILLGTVKVGRPAAATIKKDDAKISGCGEDERGQGAFLERLGMIAVDSTGKQNVCPQESTGETLRQTLHT